MRRYLPVISIILLFVLVLAVYLIGRPKYSKFKESETELRKKAAALEQKKEYYSKLTTLSKDLEKYQEEFEKIDVALPKAKDVLEPELLNFLKKKTIDNGLVLEKAGSSGLAKGQEKPFKISFSMEISGPYPYFKNFLLDLYRNSRFFEIESISFSSPFVSAISSPLPGYLFPYTQQQYIAFDFRVNLAVYYLPD